MAQTNGIPNRVTCPRQGRELDLDQAETAPYDEKFFWWYCSACQDWHLGQGCLTNPSAKNGERKDAEDPKGLPFVRSARSDQC